MPLARLSDWLIRRIHREPYSAYAVMRRVAPVLSVSRLGFHFVSRPADVARILKDPETFSSSVMAAADPFLLGADPPAHTRVRRIVTRAMTHERLERATRSAHGVLAACTDQLGRVRRDGHDVDMIASLAIPLPLVIMSNLLGIERSECPHLRRWAQAVVADASRLPGAVVSAETRELVVELERFVDMLVDTRASLRESGDDLVSALLHSEGEGDALSPAEAKRIVRLLIIAGGETTTHLIGNSLLALLTHRSGHYSVQGPDDVSRVIEETLRYDPPTQFVARRATKDVDIGGRRLRAGTILLVLLGATGRDRTVCAHAGRFDPSRSAQSHLAFGSGPHACIGASLARVEAQLALESLLPVLPTLSLSTRRNAVVRDSAFQLRGLRELWVTVNQGAD